MIATRRRVDGGIFVLKTYSEGGVVPFKLQLREVDDLDQSITSGSGRVYNGIEYNDYNKPIAYHFKKYDIRGYYAGQSVRVDAKDVIFLWHKKRPSQLREMSLMAATITRVRDIDSYMVAVSMKERIAACFAAFIKRQIPISANGNGGFGRAGATEVGKTYDTKEITPGMIIEGQPGDEMQAITPPSGGSSAADFVRVQQRLAGGGMGLSYESTSRDMSQVNYSSARQGLIDDRLTYKIEQQYWIDHFLDEIYETFLISAVLKGEIKIKNFWDEKKKHLKHDWTPPGKDWIDPLKEAKADSEALNAGLTTRQQLAAEKGLDWRDIVDQQAVELEYMRQKGVIQVAAGSTESTAKKPV